MRDKTYKVPINKPVPSSLIERLPKKEKSKVRVYQVECNDEIAINKWLKNHPDIEIVDIRATINHEETVITVIYKTDSEELEEE